MRARGAVRNTRTRRKIYAREHMRARAARTRDDNDDDNDHDFDYGGRRATAVSVKTMYY